MRIALGVLVVASVAAADPAPKSPGMPPSLEAVPAGGVQVVTRGKAVPAQIWMVGRETWTLQVQTKAKTYEIALPKAEVGTQRGPTWAVQFTAVSVGYLKQPGQCSGKIAAWFGDTYAVGTFDAGCISYRPPR